MTSASMPTALALVASLGTGCSLENALNADDEDTESDGPGDDDDDDDDVTTATTTGPDPTATGEDSTGDDQADDTTTGEPEGPPECNGRVVRVGAYNIEGIGAVGAPSFDALGATMNRIAADVVCVQEIFDGESSNFNALKDMANFEGALIADPSPAIGGDLANGCLSAHTATRVGSWDGGELEPGANDVGREILAVRVNVGGADGGNCWLGLITVHLKSGQEPIDLFRRQVEAVRLTQAIARYREEHPDDPLVVLGDINESLDDPALGSTITAIPPGLPMSYDLGQDITFTLTYDPFASLAGAGLTRLDPSQEDAPDVFETWQDTVRLDYIFLDGPELVEDEVYNSCRDDGVDDDPPGDFLEKEGEPLACAVSETASDHYPVVADIRLP